ncbi:hypothetical protein GJAV_G00071110 [Gymnothorax javanicus]|nr:hypothetical protein GJAV_G00071110 [Gymnothorax javanicus]
MGPTMFVSICDFGKRTPGCDRSRNLARRKMSAQQFPRPVVSSGSEKAVMSAGVTTVFSGNPLNSAESEEKSCEANKSPRDHPSNSGGPLPIRDDKQEAVVVRPYPQVQVHGQTLTLPQHLSVQPGIPVSVSAPPTRLPQDLAMAFTEGPMKGALKAAMPSRLIIPVPASEQAHQSVQPPVPGQVTVTIDGSMPPTSAVPVASINSQQGHSSNLQHLMAANVQIIRSSTPALQITPFAAPSHTFSSHLPRGAAAAAVMCSAKGPTVLRPATALGTGGPTAVQHIIPQPIQQSCPPVTATMAVPSVVAPVTATRPHSPAVSTVVTHSAEVAHGRPELTIHPQSNTVNIHRPPPTKDPAPRITLPSHPAICVQKTHPTHPTAQKPILSTVTPVAAATVAPIQTSNVAPLTTTAGSTPHAQMTTSNIVTVTMPPHSTHATGINASTIPVAKVVPQPIAHTAPRVHSDYPGERGNLIPISAHRSSPNTVTMEPRSDSRQSAPVQFQYILPTYPSSPYPLTHTYTPVTNSISGIRQYSVTPQAPSSARPAQAAVGVASAVHLNPMQLMTVDRIGLQSPQINQAAIGSQQPPPQAEPKASVVLADGAARVASPLSGTFGSTQPVTTAAQSHLQSSSSVTPVSASSPRPSILRKKPTNEGFSVRKSLIPGEAAGCSSDTASRSTSGSPRPAGPSAEVQMTVTPPAVVPVESLSSQVSEMQSSPSPALHLTRAEPALSPMTATPSRPAITLPSSVSVVPVTPPIPASLAGAVAPPVAISTAASTVGSVQPDLEVKQEAETMDTSQSAPSVTPSLTPDRTPPGGTPSASVGDVILGASPRKKPRKQQHIISTEESEMVEAHSTDKETSHPRPLGASNGKRKNPSSGYVDEEGVRYVPVRRRPPITLLRHYRNPWKAAYHHFQRYSDIRVKEVKKDTLEDVASRKGVACRAQGYKIRMCAAQLLQLMRLEHDVYSRLTTLQEGLIPKKRAGRRTTCTASTNSSRGTCSAVSWLWTR